MHPLTVILAFTLAVAGSAAQAQRLLPPDHSTCETAKVIEADSHVEGVEAEYAWIREHYPQHERVEQTVMMCPRGPADVLVLADEAGNEVRIVFDLSQVWGKGLDLPE